MITYLFAQISALLSSIESIYTKKTLHRFTANEHIFYKNLSLIFFSLPFVFFHWHVTLLGIFFVFYSVIFVFINENFRARAIHSLEINSFSLLMSFSIFVIYAFELLIGREELLLKNILGFFLFIFSFFLFLETRLSSFLKLNASGLKYLLGTLLIISIDRSFTKTIFDENLISPETLIFLRVSCLFFFFFFFLKKNQGNFIEEPKFAIFSHLKFGFLKYSREMLYSYALIFGSVILVTLVLNSVLFLTFILSHFSFKESKWTFRKFLAIILAIVSVSIVTMA